MHLLLPAAALADTPSVARHTALVALEHRPGEALLPALQPHLSGTGVRVSADGPRLILSGPAAALDDLVALVRELDTPPRLLTVTLVQGEGAEGLTHAPAGTPAGGRIHWSAGADGTFGEGEPEGASESWRTRPRHAPGEVLQVNVEEGEWAFFRLDRGSRWGGGPAAVAPAPGLRVWVGAAREPQGGGLRVRPRLLGERVSLDVATFGRLESFERPHLLQRQILASTLTGQLGEWLGVAAAGQVPPGDSGPGGAVVARTRERDLTQVLIRIDLTDP